MELIKKAVNLATFIFVLLCAFVFFFYNWDSLKFSLGYKPPILPLVISMDSTGEISVAISGEVQTPIGSFEVSTTSNSPQADETLRTLTVRYDGIDTIYSINRGVDFNIKFDDDVFEQVGFYKDQQENLFIELKTVGGRYERVTPEKWLEAEAEWGVAHSPGNEISYIVKDKSIIFDFNSNSLRYNYTVWIRNNTEYLLSLYGNFNMEYIKDGTLELIGSANFPENPLILKPYSTAILPKEGGSCSDWTVPDRGGLCGLLVLYGFNPEIRGDTDGVFNVTIRLDGLEKR